MNTNQDEPSVSSSESYTQHEEAIEVLRGKRNAKMHEAVEAHEHNAEARLVSAAKEAARSYHKAINALREDRGDNPLEMPTIEDVTGYSHRVTGTRSRPPRAGV